MRPIRLLLADDNNDDVLLLEEGFRMTALPVTLTRAADGQRAIEILQEVNSFDLIILDYFLPRHDAPDVLTQVRRLGAFPSCPVVVMSAHMENAEWETLKSLGAAVRVEKPSDLDGLCDLVRKLHGLVALSDQE